MTSKRISKKSKPSATKKSSKPSQKPSKPSRKKAVSASSKLPKNLPHAVALGSNGKPLKKPTGKAVTYGLAEKKNGRTVIHKLKMEPQSYSEKDLKALENLYRKNVNAQNTKNPYLTYSEIATDEVARTKSGRPKYRTVRAGPLKGQRVPVYKSKVKFDRPKKTDAYRQVLTKGTKTIRHIHGNFQKRNTYEFVKAELLGKAGFTSFSEKHSRFVGGYTLAETVLKGRTLTEALNKIQAPVNTLWLRKKKVILPKFAEENNGNIYVTGSVKLKIDGEDHDIPFSVQLRYLTQLSTALGREIRRKLADRSQTFTSIKDLTDIATKAREKIKSVKGQKTKKQKDELRRLFKPGFNPKSPNLSAALSRAAQGDTENFPMNETDKLTINMRIAFYKDPHATPIK